MSNEITFRLQLKVKLGIPFQDNLDKHSFTIDGRDVILQWGEPNQAENFMQWLYFSASGFPSEDAARHYGERLRAWVELSALALQTGVDSGADKTRGWLNVDALKEAGAIPDDYQMLPEVHGLMIYPDDGKTRVYAIEEVSVFSPQKPRRLIETIEELSENQVSALGALATSIRLLNLALMRNEPLTKAVLSFSAVETLGQDEDWSKRQRCRLRELADVVDCEAGDGDLEKGGDLGSIAAQPPQNWLTPRCEARASAPRPRGSDEGVGQAI